MSRLHQIRSKLSVVLTTLGILLVASTPLRAEWPERPITVIVPFAAGGPTDVVARLVGEYMSRTLGQQLVVENVGGAGGTIGMTRVATAAPDGYTLGMGNMGTQSAAPALYPHLKYDPATSFQQIGIANFTPQAIVAKKDTSAKDFKEFLAYLKAHSGTLSYGHAGVGSISYVAGVLFNAEYQLKPGMVAYRGTGPALNDLVAGQIDFIIDQSLNVIPQIKAGTIKAYAIASSQRLKEIPDVPTTGEVGSDFQLNAWNALVAPKGLPADMVAKLAAALDKALDEPAVVARYESLGSFSPAKSERGPEGLQRLVEREMAAVTPALKAAAPGN